MCFFLPSDSLMTPSAVTSAVPTVLRSSLTTGDEGATTGGSFELRSRPGEGTEIRAEVPLA